MLDLRPDQNKGSDETEVKETVEETEGNAPEESSTSEEASTEAEKPVEVTEDPDKDALEALKLQKESLMKEIVDLRRERRTVREEPLVVQAKSDNTVVEGVNPQDVETIEKVIKAKGYVQKDELASMTYKEKEEAAKNDWLNKHPEYLPENDPDDKNWNALKSKVNSYFRAPANPAEVSLILDSAHAMLIPQQKPLPVKGTAATAASQEKLKSTSMAGAGGSTTKDKPSVKTSSGKSIPKSMAHHLIGFTDDEVKELTS